MIELSALLKMLKKKNGSDLHLKVGAPPIMRQAKKLIIMDSKLPILTSEHMHDLISPYISHTKIQSLKEKGGIDAGITIENNRFRLNIYYQQGLISVAIRSFPSAIPSLQTLKVPNIIKELIEEEQSGLILIAGATGNGKSTSIASLINYINHSQNKHILTMEDPIEYTFKDNISLITQKELGTDFLDLNLALKNSLRQDPDIIFVSELRTQETIELALKASETGHLVLSTIHTNNSLGVISRIINTFTKTDRHSARMTLSDNLKGVMAQQLIQTKNNDKLLPIFDIFINNYSTQKEIEAGASEEKLRQVIDQGDVSNKNINFNSCLINYVTENLITVDEAIRFSPSPNNMRRVLSGIASSHSITGHTIWNIDNTKRKNNVLKTNSGKINVKLENIE